MTSKVIDGHTMSLLCQIKVVHFLNLTFRPSALITPLTYVLLNNFCPCLKCRLIDHGGNHFLESSEKMTHIFSLENITHTYAL